MEDDRPDITVILIKIIIIYTPPTLHITEMEDDRPDITVIQ